MHRRYLLQDGLRSLLELVLVMPVVVFIQAYASGNMAFPLRLTVLWAAYVAGAIALRLIRAAAKWRLCAAGGVVALLAAWIQIGPSFVGFVHAAAIFVALWQGMRSVSLAYIASSSHFVLHMLRVCAYFAASVLFPFFPSLQPYMPWIVACGAVSLIAIVIQTNRETLAEQSDSPRLLSKSALRRNRIQLLVYLLLIFAVSMLPLFNEADRAVKEGVLRAVTTVAKHAADNPQQSLFKPPSEDWLQQLKEMAEREPVPVWLSWLLRGIGETIVALLYVFLAVSVVVLAMFAARIDPRRWRLRKRIAEWFSARFGGRQPLTAGYVDEEKSLMEPEKGTSGFIRQRRARAGRTEQAVSWTKIATNDRRVRLTFRRWLTGLTVEGVSPVPSETPREIAAALSGKRVLSPEEQMLLRLYEEARYGGRNPGDCETETIRRLYESKRGMPPRMK